MKRIKMGAWVIEVDMDKTLDFYTDYHLITEDCTCDYCANYVLACTDFPSMYKGVFDSLGIDPRKEGEISHYMEKDNGTHLYGVFYHIVGRIIKGPQLWVPTQKGSEVSSPHFATYHGIELGFSEDLMLLPEGFPEPAIQFEMEVTIPWLLS